MAIPNVESATEAEAVSGVQNVGVQKPLEARQHHKPSDQDLLGTTPATSGFMYGAD
jgi:hypothetical protein